MSVEEFEEKDAIQQAIEEFNRETEEENNAKKDGKGDSDEKEGKGDQGPANPGYRRARNSSYLAASGSRNPRRSAYRGKNSERSDPYSLTTKLSERSDAYSVHGRVSELSVDSYSTRGRRSSFHDPDAQETFNPRYGRVRRPSINRSPSFEEMDSAPPPKKDSRPIEGPQKNDKDLTKTKTYAGAYFGKETTVVPHFTRGMIAFCSVLMVMEIIINGAREGEAFEDLSINPLLGPSYGTLIAMGAKQSVRIVEDGDFYRLIAPIFLHGGVLHLLFNMAFLNSFGTHLETEFGHARIAYIYLMSGFFGVLCSAIFNPTIPSVGASGACYGLIGASWADYFLNFSFYRNQWREVLCRLSAGTIFNALLGLIPQLDNFAHLGGLICGFFTGLTVMILPRYDLYANLKPDKSYQTCLKLFGLISTPVIIICFLIILYVGVDVDTYCPWCSYLSCLPTPLWSCEVSCEEGFDITDSVLGNSTIICPRDIGIREAESPSGIKTDLDVQFQFCVDVCLN